MIHSINSLAQVVVTAEEKAMRMDIKMMEKVTIFQVNTGDIANFVNGQEKR